MKTGPFSFAQICIKTAVYGNNRNSATASYSSDSPGNLPRSFTIAKINMLLTAFGSDDTPMILRGSALDAFLGGGRPLAGQTLVAVPLRTHACIAGVLVLTLWSDFVSDNDLRLLRRVGSDLAFALEYHDSRARLSYLLDFDSVTGLANRRQFLRRLARNVKSTCEEGGQLIVGLMEIAHINTVSQVFGSELADELIRHVADRLMQVAVLEKAVARLSLDCFAFSVRTCFGDATTEEIIVQRLAKAFERPFLVGDNKVCMAPRVGLSFLTEGRPCAERLVVDAASAVREAKEQRVNVVRFEPDMRVRAASRLVLETRLRTAWEERRFELHYQPQIDLKTGKIVGIEALIRWREPCGTQISPQELVRVLEDTGLIIDVGMWVLETALRQCMEWKAMALPVPRLAVNFSHIQIDQAEFVPACLSKLNEVHGIELECEITESVFAGNIESSIEKLEALRKAGAKIAIDDFGTGYSSLGAVSRLPIDTVKIDRSFLTLCEADETKRSIMDTIVSLAKSLSLRVIAEGVECREQEIILKHLGCDEAQGFYYSRPLAPVQIERLLAEQRASLTMCNGSDIAAAFS